MLLTIEKVIILKSTEVFASMPDHVLAFIASIVEEVDVPKGETFITKGDIGNCMYLIVEGTVLVHDEGRRIILVAVSGLDPAVRTNRIGNFQIV